MIPISNILKSECIGFKDWSIAQVFLTNVCFKGLLKLLHDFKWSPRKKHMMYDGWPSNWIMMNDGCVMSTLYFTFFIKRIVYSCRSYKSPNYHVKMSVSKIRPPIFWRLAGQFLYRSHPLTVYLINIFFNCYRLMNPSIIIDYQSIRFD